MLREGSKFRFGICVTKQQVVPRVVCLCGAVGVSQECHRVGHVVINFTTEGIFDQKEARNLLHFTLISSLILPFYATT